MTQFRYGAFTLPDTNGLFTFTDSDSDTGSDCDLIPVDGTKGPFTLTSDSGHRYR